MQESKPRKSRRTKEEKKPLWDGPQFITPSTRKKAEDRRPFGKPMEPASPSGWGTYEE